MNCADCKEFGMPTKSFQGFASKKLKGRPLCHVHFTKRKSEDGTNV